MSLPTIYIAIVTLLLFQLLQTRGTFGWKQCNFTRKTGNVISIPYEEKDFICKKCSNNNVNLVTNRNRNPCSKICNGLKCYDSSKCTVADDISKSILKRKPAISKEMCRDPTDVFPSDDREEKSRNHIPLIIGFAVGGIMLAVVIAGVLLGRANRALSPNDSSIVTTPVSMSYSEWISNYSTGGWGTKNLNNRVQESAGSLSDLNDSQALAVYSLVYGDANLASPEKRAISDDEPTVIEIDGIEGYGNGHHHLTSYYQPHNDVLSCVATPLRNEKDFVAMEWQDKFYPYESVVQLRKDEMWNSETGSCYPCSTQNSAQFDQNWWSTVQSIRRDSFATNSIYSKRRDTWSDESTGDHLDFDARFPFYNRRISGDRISSHSAWVKIPRQLSINFANLRHVFVDVHRSMSYSFDDACNHGYWAPSDGSDIYDEISVFDNNEKRNSYITIKSHYICYGSNTMPRLHDQVLVYSLPRSPSVGHRRCSI